MSRDLEVVSEDPVSTCHVTAMLVACPGTWWGDPDDPRCSMYAVLEMSGTGSFPLGTPFGMPTPPSITVFETAESPFLPAEKRVARRAAGSKFP